MFNIVVSGYLKVLILNKQFTSFWNNKTEFIYFYGRGNMHIHKIYIFAQRGHLKVLARDY